MSLKDAIRKSKLRRTGGDGDIRAFMMEAAETAVEELFAQLQAEMRTLGLAELKKVAATIKKGDKGDKGETGKTVVGPRGFVGKSVQGKPGTPGRDGVGKKGDKGEPGKDGSKMTQTELLEKLNKFNGSIEIKTIKGLQNFLTNLQRAVREKGSGGRKHGGGMTLAAGANITLTRNANGTWTVASTGGSGGSNIATELVTAVASGSNVTIDLTQMAHTSSGVLFVTRNGQVLMPNGNANLPGSSYSQAAAVVTVYNADPTDIYLVQYTYA